MSNKLACDPDDPAAWPFCTARCLATCFYLAGLASVLLVATPLTAQLVETLPPLDGPHPPSNFEQMWRGFDPRSEPLEIETLHEWEEDGTALRIVRFRIGVFKGVPASLAAIYGFPQAAAESGKKIPGLLQIHGGGQYADYKACLANAKRGYATLSIAWAGRISAPNYRVGPNEVRLFWEDKTDDPNYKLTTDWGAVDGYHAPSRNPKNNFPGLGPAEWTLDPVDSPRNSPWFLCALAARRGLTFLEQQPEVDPARLGVYGHSMGGKLTVMTSVDERVKAAAPSCGGISDRDNASPLFRQTIGDDVSLKQVRCPIVFLSPANDFHGRIGDLPAATREIASDQWRVTCSAHHNHQDTAEFSVATLLWFDQFLKKEFDMPQTPVGKLQLKTSDGIPVFSVQPDPSKPFDSIDLFYTQQAKTDETRFDRDLTMNRHWHHVKPTKSKSGWSAPLPVSNIDQPLWVLANVNYPLDHTVAGAGYYYGPYSAESFNLSSLLQTATPQQLKQAGVKPGFTPSHLIEDFKGDWQKEWFSYRPENWPVTTHKLFDERYHAPPGATLSMQVRTDNPNQLVVLIDHYAAVVDLDQVDAWQTVELSLADFKNFENESLTQWKGIKTLKLSDAEHLKSSERGSRERRVVGRRWQGPAPEFRDLRWKRPPPSNE